MIKIFIVEDHDLTRMMLEAKFDDFDDMRVVGSAESGERFFEMLPAAEVDIALLDVGLPDGMMQGAEVARRLRSEYPEIKMLVVSLEKNIEAIQEILEAGVDGFVSKQKGTPAELAVAIRSVMNGSEYYTQDISTILAEFAKAKNKNLETPGDLTERELRVLEFCRDGLQGKEIADRLNISISTVNNHKQKIFRKFGFNSIAEAVLYALRKKYISLE